MGRKRRKEIKIVRKKIPTIFNCPKCGSTSVSVQPDKEANKSFVKCGSCGLSGSYEVKAVMKAVDAYNMFVDEFFKQTQSAGTTS